MQTILAYLDRLFPPTFERITASIERARARLVVLKITQYKAAFRERTFAAAAESRALALTSDAERAYRVAQKLADLVQ